MEVGIIYSQFRQTMLGYIKRKVNSAEDAEDIVQNIFAKISSDANSLSGKKNIQHWLFAVARNAIVDYYRARIKQQSISIPDNLIAFAEEDDADAAQWLLPCVHNMIALLPEHYRNVLTDSEINGLKQKDLANKYAIPYSSLRSRIQRGREQLKQLFMNCCQVETDAAGKINRVGSKNACPQSGCHKK